MASMQDALNNKYQGMTHTGRKPQGLQFAQDAMQGIQNAPGNILKWAQNNPIEAGLTAVSTVTPYPFDAIPALGAEAAHYYNNPDNLTPGNLSISGASVLAPAIPGMAVLGALKKTVLDLPMDEASRMARAKKQGFDVDVPMYHGTSANVDAFNLDMRGNSTQANTAKKATWLTDDPVTASAYANYSANTPPVRKLLEEAEQAEKAGNWSLYDKKLIEAETLEKKLYDNYGLNGQNIMPVYSKNEGVKYSIFDQSKKQPEGLVTKNMKDRSFDDFGVKDEIEMILDQARLDGYSGVKFKNLNDAPGLSNRPSSHIAVFDPKNIRSKFADFNPLKKNSTDLLAGIGGATIIAPSMINALQGKDRNP